ncbi:allophanate hydrolase [Sporolactobacillus sp. THM7-4]|nr:allophanate hydrolase [Sporolactobacillus sp. THM7-4]
MNHLTDIPLILTIQWLRQNYLNRKLTPDIVVDTIIDRANKDKQMNIWITKPDRSFIQPYLDRLSEMPIEKSPLWGIPFAIKDNIDLAGVQTTAGCPDYAYIPDEHATVVKNLIEAGGIPLGKTNLDQFATGLVGTRSPYGEVHNALKEELISGGSSAGSAVAVARGQAAFSLGTDTAGSGRVPAALNRLVGFKSSCGAWSTRGVVPACASLDCITVFTHNVEDALAVDRVARTFDHHCPWSKPIAAPQSKVPKKIYLPKSSLHFFGPYVNEFKTAWERTVRAIKETGLPIEWIDYDFFADIAKLLYDGPFVAERWADLGPFVDSHPGSVYPVTEHILKSGAKESYTAALLFENIHKLAEAKQKVKALLHDSVFVTPTAGGTWTREQVRKDPIKTNSEMGEYTNHCNLLDLCAISVPFDDAAENLPFGATIFATSDHEDFILGLAKEFQNESTNKTQLLIKDSTEHYGSIQLAVCGLHMRGFELEHQLHEHDAQFLCEAETANKYRLFLLDTNPSKPGLIKTETDGYSIHVELWNIPISTFGSFTASIPSPLGIGKIELKDGRMVPGFICESYAVKEAKDISSYGGWKSYINA